MLCRRLTSPGTSKTALVRTSARPRLLESMTGAEVSYSEEEMHSQSLLQHRQEPGRHWRTGTAQRAMLLVLAPPTGEYAQEGERAVRLRSRQ